MNFRFVIRRFSIIVLCLCAFAGLGLVGNVVHKELGLGVKQEQIQARDSGVIFAILGGYGNVIADFSWIKAYVYWEQKNLDECIANMDFAIAINPKMKMFWTFASSTLAYDSPYWIMEQRGQANKQQINRIQARKGIAYLERALEYFPDDTGLLINMSAIYDTKLDDLKNAIACYEKVCAVEDGFIYTKRAYADLLARDGQTKKAIEVLEGVLKQLRTDSKIYEVVLDRIQELKK